MGISSCLPRLEPGLGGSCCQRLFLFRHWLGPLLASVLWCSESMGGRCLFLSGLIWQWPGGFACGLVEKFSLFGLGFLELDQSLGWGLTPRAQTPSYPSGHGDCIACGWLEDCWVNRGHRLGEIYGSAAVWGSGRALGGCG